VATRTATLAITLVLSVRIRSRAAGTRQSAPIHARPSSGSTIAAGVVTTSTASPHTAATCARWSGSSRSSSPT
jgi:hypothetical protein